MIEILHIFVYDFKIVIFPKIWFDKIDFVSATSDQYFEQNPDKKYDFIYIDGSHKAEEVLDDCVSSWKILNKGGLLILDDFFWKGYDNIEDNTAH